jgi:hypothetical protein
MTDSGRASAYERILERLDGVRRNGKRATARCPVHEDHDPSLSITPIEGQTLIYCHAGCDTADVMAKIGLELGDLFDDRGGTSYRYDDGRIVHRTYDKDGRKRFYQSGNTNGQRAELFRSGRVRQAITDGSTVWFVEGEKDVLALESLGETATTAPQGAANVGKCDLSPLHGAHIIAVIDKDKAGQKWAGQLAGMLAGKASIEFVHAAEGKDAADHIAAGHGLGEFVQAETEPEQDQPQDDLPTSHAALLLPDEFWNADEKLQNIRAYAHSRRTSADAFLYNVLARIAAMVPPECRLDTGIGSEAGASLNLFVAAVGPAGRGKSSSKSVAKIVIPPEELHGDRFREELPIGSGEGIAEAYMGTVTEYDPNGALTRSGQPKEVRLRKQVRRNAFFYLDEGEVFSKLRGREGAILGGTIRSAWYGDLIGTANADSDRYRVVPEGNYSLGMLIGFQPETVQPLLKDAYAGTPQRFVYCWTIDSTRPRRPPRTDLPLIAVAAKPQIMTLDPEVADEISDHHDDQSTGAIDVALLDAHDYLTRAKLAPLLALLRRPSTTHVTRDDWRLAAMMWEISCKVRDYLVRYGDQLDRRRRYAADQANAEREGMAEIARSGQKSRIERVARNIAKHVHDSGDRTVGAVRDHRIAYRDRDVFEAALDHAEAHGWVVVDATDLEPGESRPSEVPGRS